MIQTPSLRIGIEEEYQIVDPETRNLRYILTRTAVAERPVLRGRETEAALSDELTAAMIELAEPSCRTVGEARRRAGSSAPRGVRIGPQHGHAGGGVGNPPVCLLAASRRAAARPV